MAYDPYALKIHIDGSAYRNPGGVGGIAAIVEYPDTSDKEPETILQIGFAETTNQRMEWRVRDRGFQSGKVGRSRLRGTSSSLYPAKGQIETVRIYRKGSSYGGPSQKSKVFFEVYSQTEKTYVSKHHAYTSLRIESEVHRGHLYRVRFNDNPKYPIIEEIIEEIVPD